MTQQLDPEVKRALAAMEKLGDLVFKNGLRAGRVAAARVVRDAAKKSVIFRDRTKNLRKSIKVQNSKRYTRVYANAPHAYVVERGQDGPTPSWPRPFMEHAARGTVPQQLDAAAQALARIVKRAHKTTGRR